MITLGELDGFFSFGSWKLLFECGFSSLIDFFMTFIIIIIVIIIIIIIFILLKQSLFVAISL